MTMTRQAVQHCRYIQCLRVCHSILVTLKGILRAEPSAALHATDGILLLLYDVALFAYSAAVCNQPGFSHRLQVRDVDSCMWRDCISGNDDEVTVRPAVELGVEIFVLGGLAATLALQDALPEDGHASGQIPEVSLPYISQLFEVVSNPHVNLLQ